MKSTFQLEIKVVHKVIWCYISCMLVIWSYMCKMCHMCVIWCPHVKLEMCNMDFMWFVDSCHLSKCVMWVEMWHMWNEVKCEMCYMYEICDICDQFGHLFIYVQHVYNWCHMCVIYISILRLNAIFHVKCPNVKRVGQRNRCLT